MKFTKLLSLLLALVLTAGLFAGCGNSAKGITAALHNQQFDVDEDCIPLGIQLQMTFLMDLLQK